MAKQLLIVSSFLLLGVASTCLATTYTVGDISGWDISTDLDTWSQGKRFAVGDVLLFQYSSYHSVAEVDKGSFEGCNTTNKVLQSSSNGNTTIALTSPGERYFVCGNRLHCLGGMKLQVNVLQANQMAPAPAPAPEAEAGGDLPTGSRNRGSSAIPSSAILNCAGIVSLIPGILVSLGIVLGLM